MLFIVFLLAFPELFLSSQGVTVAAKGYFDALVKLGELASDSQGSKELGEWSPLKKSGFGGSERSGRVEVTAAERLRTGRMCRGAREKKTSGGMRK